MAFRFRKSIGRGPFRINISKSGIGTSIGCKGYRVTKKAGGGFRSTASIPGTGLSYVSESGNSNKNYGRPQSASSLDLQYSSSTYFVSSFLLKVIGIFMLVLGLILTLAVPPIGVISIAAGILELIGSKTYKKKAKAAKELESQEEKI